MSGLGTVLTTSEGDRRLGEHLIEWACKQGPRKEGETKADGWPRTLEEFMEDVDAAWMSEDGVASAADIQIPRWMKSIQFVQSNMETLLVRLPPADLVEASLERLKNQGDYPLPDFYREAINNPPDTYEERLELFQHRVGDYVIAHCM